MEVPASDAGTCGFRSDLHGSAVGEFANNQQLVNQAIAGAFNEMESGKGSSQIVDVPMDQSIEESKGEK